MSTTDKSEEEIEAFIKEQILKHSRAILHDVERFSDNAAIGGKIIATMTGGLGASLCSSMGRNWKTREQLRAIHDETFLRINHTFDKEKPVS